MFRLADSSDDDDDRGTSSVPFPSASPVDVPVRPGVPRTTSSSVLLANGKPLKSSLKSSSSSPSLVLPPRTRSEPATPLLAPKNVHFPEGDLVSVRVFNRSARPASLSKPVGDDTETETETDNNSVIWPAASSYFRAVATKPVVAKKAFQLNTQACSKVPRKHEQLDLYANVHLEGIQLKSSTAASPAVTGSILVRNVAFEKSVAVRFTLDGWQTTSEVAAHHQASLAGLPDEFLRSSAPASYGLTIGDLAAKSPEWDRFSFTIKLEDYAQHLDQKTMWLVVRYSVPGDDGHHEWWDNNGGANYKIGFRAASSSPHTLPKLSFPIARAVSASAAVPLRHQKFFSYPHTTTPTPRHELPAYPYHRSEEPPPEREKLLQDQYAQHQAAVAQTTLSRLKKLNLRNYAAPSPTASPIVSPYSSPNSSRRPSVSTSSADSVDVVAITSSGSSSASTSGSSAETTPMSSPKASFLGLGLGQNERKPYAAVDLDYGLDLGMQFQDGAPATSSAPVHIPVPSMGAVEWGLGTSPPFSMLSSHQSGFNRRHHHHHEAASAPAPVPTPNHPPRRVRKPASGPSATRRSAESSSSDTDRGLQRKEQHDEEEEQQQLQGTPRQQLLSSPSHHNPRLILSGVNGLLDEIKEKSTSPGSQRKSGRDSSSGSGSGSGSRSGSGSSSGSSSSSDSESNGPIYTRSSSPRRTQTQTQAHSPPPQPPPALSSSPGPSPLSTASQPGTPDSVYQAFVRQWCFAQGAPGSPGLGVIVR